jgi:hypothetical protein
LPRAAPDPAPAVAPAAAVIVVGGGGGTAAIAAASIAAPAGVSAIVAAVAGAAAHRHRFLSPKFIVHHSLPFVVHVSLPALGLGLCPYSPALFVSVSDTLLVYKWESIYLPLKTKIISLNMKYWLVLNI